jgi:D-alanyl-lipoteichoic acid acyltransferase DltB (MBOAT superfamily)
MLFNSGEYLFFFGCVFAFSWLVASRPPLRLVLLLAASYYFYAVHNTWLIVLILISTQVDFMAGLAIAEQRSEKIRKLWLILSLCTNLGILGFFKYFNFFMSSASSAAYLAGWPHSWVNWSIALPVGISFYTFQSMSYTIDVYRRAIPAERSWVRFAFYVSFFPQLVAGPILRASEFLPQLNKKPALSPGEFERALMLIVRGLFKKVVLADYLALYADPAFNIPENVGQLTAWIGVYAFAFQIYYDFSGYTDIAIGCSRLLGYRIPDNFRTPYMAVSFSDFWKRWHISLSSWLRDYLYFPLGGNRMAAVRSVYRNVMLTMLIGGLWHGAAWHFVLWGGAHGVFLVIERSRGAQRKAEAGEGGLLRRLAVFHGVVLTWMLFRCPDIGHFASLLITMFSGDPATTIRLGQVVAGGIILGSWLSQYLASRYDLEQGFLSLPLPVKSAFYATAAMAITIFSSATPRAFIYFKF